MAFSISYKYQIQDLYSGPLAKIRKATDKFNRTVKKTKTSMKGFSKRMSGLQSTAAALGGVIGGTALVGNFVSFETAMNVAKGQTKATDEQFAALSETAKKLGSTTQFSATQAAQGIGMLGKNGLDATKIMNGAIDAALLLSAATGTDLSNSADIATDVMSNFGKKASDLGGIVNKLAGVTLNSKFDIDDYRLALGQAGGVAGEFGVSLSDFNTSIAAIAPLFAAGSEAGTGFKTFLQRLNPESKEAAKYMRLIGILTKDGKNQFFDAAGSMKSMAEISQVLNKALSGLSDQQLSKAGKMIFGTDAIRVAIGLSKISAEEFENLSKAIANVSAQKLAEDRMRGLGGVLRETKSVLESLNIAIFESGLDVFLIKVISKFKKFVKWLTKLNPKILKFGGIITLAAIVLAPLIVGVGIISAAIAAIGTPVLIAIGVIAALSAEIYLAWDYLKEYKEYWMALLGPIGLVVAATKKVINTMKDMIAQSEFLTGVFDFFGLGPDKTVNHNIATSGSVTAENVANSKGTLDGAITVSAGPGSKVNKASMKKSMPGNLGMNMYNIGGAL